MNCITCKGNTLSNCKNCNSNICSKCSKEGLFHHLNFRYCPICDKVFNMRINLSTSFFDKNNRYDLIGVDYDNKLYQILLRNGKNGYSYFNSSVIWEETPPKCCMHENCKNYICTDNCYNFDNNFKHYEANKDIISQYAKYRENYNNFIELEYEKKKDAMKDNINYEINFENIEKMSFEI